MFAETTRILLIEDDPGDCRLIEGMLQDAVGPGFELLTAGSLAAAIEQVDAGKPDVVLMDLLLPDSGAPDTFTSFRSKVSGVPVVVLTGLDDTAAALKALHDGAQDYLIKGRIDGGLLARSIRYAIERHQTRNKLEHQSLKLMDREKRLDTIIRASAEGIAIVDRDGIVLFVNPAAEAILGRDAADVTGRAFGFPLVSGLQTEVDVISADDRVRVAEMRVTEVDWDGSRVQLVSLRDITQHKEMLKELEESRKQQIHLKDRFLSHVSHELRSPLAAVDQFVSILLDEIPGKLSERQREYLGIVSRNVEQLGAMINDLLLVTRSMEDRVSINRRQVDVWKVLKEAVSTFKAAAAEKVVKLAVDESEDLPRVLADPVRIKEVLTNLIDNALRFTPPNGTITIGAWVDAQDPDFVRVWVTDSGSGIEEQEIEKIFDPLHQSGRGNDSGRQGLGLGLSICKSLVIRQGGRIWAESRPGHGTTISFTLPAFSLAGLLVPILTRDNLKRGVLAVVKILMVFRPEAGMVEYVDRAVRAARDNLNRCIVENRDAVLPTVGADDSHRSTVTVACTDRRGAEILVRMARDRLSRVDDLGPPQVETTVVFDLVEIPPDIAESPAELAAAALADAIEGLVFDSFEKEECQWQQRQSS